LGLDVPSASSTLAFMDDRIPRIANKRSLLLEGFGFPMALGVVLGAFAFITSGDGAHPSSISDELFMSAILLTIVDPGATQMIMYVTPASLPDEQRREANARFYAWERARVRYLVAFISGTSIGLSQAVVPSEPEQTIVFFAAFGLYAIPFIRGLILSLREAKRLFPSSGAR